jgi:hypothetical protein
LMGAAAMAFGGVTEGVLTWDLTWVITGHLLLGASNTSTANSPWQ